MVASATRDVSGFHCNGFAIAAVRNQEKKVNNRDPGLRNGVGGLVGGGGVMVETKFLAEIVMTLLFGERQIKNN